METEITEKVQIDAYKYGKFLTNARLQNMLPPEEKKNVSSLVIYDHLVCEVDGIEEHEEVEVEEQIVADVKEV